MKPTQPEELLRHMRIGLAYAQQMENKGQHELADALGARAANKLAQAIHLQSKVVPIRR